MQENQELGTGQSVRSSGAQSVPPVDLDDSGFFSAVEALLSLLPLLLLLPSLSLLLPLSDSFLPGNAVADLLRLSVT